MIIIYYNVTKKVIMRIDNKSSKDINLTLIINYNFDKSTIIIVIQSIFFSFY